MAEDEEPVLKSTLSADGMSRTAVVPGLSVYSHLVLTANFRPLARS